MFSQEVLKKETVKVCCILKNHPSFLQKKISHFFLKKITSAFKFGPPFPDFF